MSLILVIDADAKVRSTLNQRLALFAYAVIDAADSRMGIRLFQERRPELVIVDILVPSMEGLQCIQELRAIHASVPIIATSASTTVGGLDVLELAGRFGANRALQKPLDTAKLLAAVREELASSKAA